MRTPLLLVLLVLTGPFTALSQNTPVEHWVKNISGSAAGYDTPNTSFRDNSGQTYIAGINAGGTFLCRFDNTGVVNMSLQYVDSNNVVVYPKMVQTDASGNIYLCGEKFYGTSYFVTVVKFDNGGTLLWNKDFNANYGAQVVEAFASDHPTNPTTFAYTGRVNDSLAVGKFSLTTGSWSWNKRYFPGFSSYLYAKGLDVKIAGGNIYACGVALNTVTANDAVIIKVNGAGSQMYMNTIDGSSSLNDYAAKVAVNSSGEAFIYGSAYSPTLRLFLAKFSSIGGTDFTTYYTNPVGETVDYPVDMEFNSAYTQLYTIGQMNGGASAQDGALILWDPATGAINYSEIVNSGSDSEIFGQIVVDNMDNYYIAGMKNVSNFKLRKYDAFNTWLYDAVYPTTVTGFNGLHTDNTGNAYIAGSKYYTYTLSDAILAKFGASGSFLWDGTFNAEINSSDYSSRILTDMSGNVTFAGNSNNAITGFDVIVKKHDGSGTELWTNTIDYSTHDNNLIGMDQDASNNVFVCASDNIGNRTDITKIDAFGNVLWTNYLGFYNSTAFSVKSSGDFVIGKTGTTGQSNFEIGQYTYLAGTVWTSAPMASSMNMNLTKTFSDAAGNVYAAGIQQQPTGSLNWLYLEKYSSTGTWLWGTQVPGFDSTEFPEIRNVLFDNAGNLIMGANVFTLAGNMAVGFVKFDATTGSIIYRKAYNASETRQQAMLDFSLTSTNEIIVPGGYFPIGLFFPTTATISRFTATGNFMWEYTQPTLMPMAQDYFQFAKEDVDGNIVGCARMMYKPNPFTTGSLVTTVKLNPAGTSIWTKNFESTYPGSVYMTDFELYNNRIYLTGTALMSPGMAEDNVLIKYCDNPAPTILESDMVVCNGSLVSLHGSGSYTTYTWHPLESPGHQLDVTTSGNYWFTGVEADGCAKISDTISVTIKSIPTTPDICAVTVDTASTHNIIYWDKSGYTDVSHFVVYREDVTNIYTAVGSIPYDSLSEFHDYGANPNITTKRYKLTAVDTCGVESNQSLYHNTLYVSDNGSGDFTWNLYEIEGGSNPVTTFELLRDDAGTGVWNVVGTTAGTQQILSDPTYATWPDGEWYVRTVWGITCTPTRAGISTSRSNIRTKNGIVTGISNETNPSVIGVYPNPAGNEINVQWTNADFTQTTVSLKDASGRLIDQKTTLASTIKFDLSSIDRGVYFIEVLNEISKTNTRFVKQ
ncbi:MAG TPA: T9SS type A sorting domain-containing protein [Flavobacteriales bacterium]|nr:T9SS type A sorting domain-containing protein [Flavobacteriales bacterium]